MAQGDHSELYMKFVDRDNKPVKGESTAALGPGGTVPNPLALGFRPGQMFEIESFSLTAGDSATSSDYAKQMIKLGMDPRALEDQMKASGKSNQIAASPIQPVSFTRQIDAASAALIQNLASTNQGFQSASVIKRKAAGTGASGEVYFRIDFDEVLITDIGWDSGDEVSEKCSFICRGITVRYRRQNDDGTLGPVVYGKWPT
jgi:type VI protein secretion system component Hcp